MAGSKLTVQAHLTTPIDMSYMPRHPISEVTDDRCNNRCNNRYTIGAMIDAQQMQ
jgi:hypothetical protein